MHVSFFSLLTIVFITLKLAGVIDWSWVWVLSPLWIVILITIFVFISMVIFTGLHKDARLIVRKKK